jgi:nitroreductase
MQFQDVINNRKTIRDFSTKKIDLSIVQKAIENGFKAPTYNHLKEWHFLIIDNANLKEKITETEEMYSILPDNIKASLSNYDEDARTMYLEAIPKQKRMIIEAPYVITVAYKPKTRIEEARRVYDLNCLASVWCCIENFLLSLAENDIFGVTFVSKNTNCIRSVLNIPDTFEVASIIPIGYMKKNINLVKQKDINIIEHIHMNKWDNTLLTIASS